MFKELTMNPYMFDLDVKSLARRLSSLTAIQWEGLDANEGYTLSESGYSYYELNALDGNGLTLKIRAKDEKRIEVFARSSMPKFLSPSHPAFYIPRNKSTEQMSELIYRKLLSKYIPSYLEALERDKEFRSYLAEARAKLKALSVIAKTDMPSLESSLVSVGRQDIRRIEYVSSTSVHLDLSVSYKQAELILRLLS
jgi:hypothetical protein